MAEHNNLYQNVVYYDVIFERDVCREVDFILATYRHYVGGEAQATWVEADMRHIQLNEPVAEERLLLPQELCLLAEMSGDLQVIGWHGDFDLAQSLDDTPASRRMIAIFQKQEATK